jgi:hypothetical protein
VDESEAKLTRGLCPQCWEAYRLAIREIIGEATPMRDRLRACGDEAGIAAADAYQFVIREARRRMRER